MTPEDETWLPVVGYEGLYEVSDHGRVRSIRRVVMRSDGTPLPVAERILAGYTNVESNGATRRTVNLSCDGRRRTRYIHSLVMEAFIGPRPAGADICHGNGDGADNSLSNLRYDSRSANLLDAVRHGTHHSAAKTHCLRGHLLAEPNLSLSDLGRGHRYCLACNRARGAIRRARVEGRPYDMQQWSDDHYVQIMRSSA